MKRLIYLLSAIVFFCSCEKLYESFEPIVNEAQNKLPQVIYAHMADSKDEEGLTRTYVDNKRVLWQKGDAILYCAGETLNARYVYNGEDGSTSAEFTKDNSVPGNSVVENDDPNVAPENKAVAFSLGIYPYSDITTRYYDGDNPYYFTYADYQETQIYAPNSFGPGANSMIAVGKNSIDDNLHFKNLCGFLVIKLYGNCLVKSIKLSANDENIMLAGSILLRVYSDGVFEYGGWSTHKFNSVTLDCSNGGEGVELSNDPDNPTEFWFALPAVTIEGGITIDITDGFDNVITKSTDKTVEITRNNIQPMAALSLDQLNPESQMFLYTRAGNNKTPLTFDTAPFDAEILNHYYDEFKQQFVIKFKSVPTQINEGAFKDKDITTMSIPEGISTIKERAFEGSALTSLTIPANVSYILKNAFSYCRNLTTIDIKKGFNPSIYDLTFYLCNYGETEEQQSDPDYDGAPFLYSPLSKITIDRDFYYVHYDSNQTLNISTSNAEYGLFYTDESVRAELVTVEIGDNFHSLKHAMLCSLNIEHITLPKSIYTILYPSPFYNCKKLKTATINCIKFNSSTHVLGGDLNSSFRGKGMFEGCSALETVTYGGDFYSIDNVIFDGCNNLKTINITGSVGTIADETFKGLDITSVNISGHVGTIGKNAFKDCDKMTSLTITGEVNTIGESAFQDNDAMEQVEISGTVAKIDKYAFNDCDGFTTLTVPASVGEIGNYAFSDCDGLEDLTVRTDIIGDYAFYDCDALQSLIATGNMNSIGQYAFNGCGELSMVNINGNVGTIGENAFNDCDKMTLFQITGSVNTLGNKALYDCNALEEAKISGTVNSIGEYAFYNCDKLNTLNFIDKVEKIGNNAFDNCDGFTALTIPASVSEIGNYAFTNCDGLKELTIQTAKVGDYAFYDCDALTNLVIDGTVNSIGTDAFFLCEELSDLTINQSPTATVLECGCASVSDSPFYSAPLKSVYLDREIIVPGNPGLFSGKNRLTSVTLGSQVKKLNSHTFYKTNITSIKIPASVKEIGYNSFLYCEALTKVEIEESDTPLTIGYQLTNTADLWTSEYGPFYDSPLTSISLKRAINYVKGSADEPFTPDGWEEGLFANKHYNVTDLSTTVELGSKMTAIYNYMFSGVRMETIDIPTSVTSIGVQAFYDCRILKSVYLRHDTPPTLGGEAFDSCDLNPKIYVPSSRVTKYQSDWSKYSSLITGWNPPAN